MNRTFLGTASLLGALAVVLGAFGAHALRSRISSEDLAVYETGVRYQFFHVLALLAVAILAERFPHGSVKWAGRCFIAGIILFSGSLYALTFLKMASWSGWKLFGIITPFGGLFLIAGWILLFRGVNAKAK